MKLLLGELFLRLDAQKKLLSAFEFSAVKGLLFTLDFAKQVLLDPIRQVFGHLRFGAPEQEGAHAGGKPSSRERVAFIVVEPPKLRAAAENAGHREGHQAPQIGQSVFDWG